MKKRKKWKSRLSLLLCVVLLTAMPAQSDFMSWIVGNNGMVFADDGGSAGGTNTENEGNTDTRPQIFSDSFNQECTLVIELDKDSVLRRDKYSNSMSVACDLTLDLKGHTLDFYGSSLYLNNNLTIKNGKIINSKELTNSTNSMINFVGVKTQNYIITDTFTLTLDNVTFENISFTDNNDSILYVQNGNLDMKNCSFVNNNGSNAGTCILYESPMNGTIKDVTFSNNSVEGKGGAIYCKANSKVTVSGSTFDSNSAGQNGGAIYNAGTLILGSGNSFVNNTVGTKQDTICINPTGKIAFDSSFYSSNNPANPVPTIPVNTAPAPQAGTSIAFTDANATDYSAYFSSDNQQSVVCYNSTTKKLELVYTAQNGIQSGQNGEVEGTIIDVGFDNASSYYLTIPTSFTVDKTLGEANKVSGKYVQELSDENGSIKVHDGTILYTERVKIGMQYDGKLKYGARVAGYELGKVKTETWEKQNSSGDTTPGFYYANWNDVEDNGKTFHFDIAYDANEYEKYLVKSAGDYKSKVVFSAAIEKTGFDVLSGAIDADYDCAAISDYSSIADVVRENDYILLGKNPDGTFKTKTGASISVAEINSSLANGDCLFYYMPIYNKVTLADFALEKTGGGTPHTSYNNSQRNLVKNTFTAAYLDGYSKLYNNANGCTWDAVISGNPSIKGLALEDYKHYVYLYNATENKDVYARTNAYMLMYYILYDATAGKYVIWDDPTDTYNCTHDYLWVPFFDLYPLS